MTAKKEEEGYTLKLEGPGHAFERVIPEDVATKIITFVIGGAELCERQSRGDGGGGGGHLNQSRDGKDSAAGATLTPRQFMALKKPGSNYERVACLAYYLTNYRDTPHFKTADISKLNTESGHHFSNAATFVNHTTATYRYLSAAGGGKKQITILGEALVDALPDRAKVAEAVAEHQPRKRTAKRKKTAKK